MKVSFLTQGFEEYSPKAFGNYLIDLLNLKDFHSFIGISAFASKAAIYGLSTHLENAKMNFKHLSLVVGIDLGGTSKEALEEILSLNINSYIFYQKEQVIFHPKIYIFEGTKHVKVIIGSSNLTTSGLFTNIESSVLVEFDTEDQEGQVLLSEIKSYYRSIFDFSDPNLFKINKRTIEAFHQLGIIVDEKTQREIFEKKLKTGSTGVAEKMTTNLIIPRRKKAKVSKFFLSKTNETSVSFGLKAIQNTPKPQKKDLVWQKKSLSRSDAQVVIKKSNPTKN